MSRNATLTRVLLLLEMLRGQRQTLEGLASRLRVTTRTIRRDLEALRFAGVPVEKIEADGEVSYWRVPMVRVGGNQNG